MIQNASSQHSQPKEASQRSCSFAQRLVYATPKTTKAAQSHLRCNQRVQHKMRMLIRIITTTSRLSWCSTSRLGSSHAPPRRATKPGAVQSLHLYRSPGPKGAECGFPHTQTPENLRALRAVGCAARSHQPSLGRVRQRQRKHRVVYVNNTKESSLGQLGDGHLLLYKEIEIVALSTIGMVVLSFVQ